MSEPKKRDAHEQWRAEALALGVNPDEPDDFRYWSELDRKKAIIRSFRYHQPSPEQIERISAVRNGFTDLARLVMRSTRGSADQTAALRQLHEAMMTVNKAIVNEG